MRRLIYYLFISGVFQLISSWILVSFITLEFNPQEWEKGERMALIAITILLYILLDSIGFINHIKNKKL